MRPWTSRYPPKVRADFVVRNASELFTCAGPAPRLRDAMANAGRIENATLAALDGRIVFVGAASSAQRQLELTADATVVDATGCAVVPGFVDAHTHVVYLGDRRHELRRRLAGATYAQIAAEGGGILSTVAATGAANVEELVEATKPRLAEMLRAGTTTAEVKSGYGLTLPSEIRMLEAVVRLSVSQPIELSATFMGAHGVPVDYAGGREAYVRHLCDDMIPEIARRGLAEWCDVFCEKGVFSPGETEEILEAGRRAGLKPRVHANELGSTGGAWAAAQLRVTSADHLVFLEDAEIAALAASRVVATLLPSAAFYLKLGRFAPARQLIDAGVPVAIATDVNPGGGLSPSMPFAMSLACFAMHLTFEEALVAATLHGALSLDRANRVGSLERGKQCDAVVVNGPAAELLRAGVAPIRQVIKRGRVVVG
jgi:imidazolonepropionase